VVEPSFAEAVAIIAAAEELPRQLRRHWGTSLRRMAKALDKPLESLPARWSAIWPLLAQLHPAPTGMKLKTLLNHRANVKRALLWLARADCIPKRGAPLAPAWEALRARLGEGIPRSTFSLLMRFSSGHGIAPDDVDEGVIDRYILHRAQVGKAADIPYRRGLARAWNANVAEVEGWPARRLVEPPLDDRGKPAWEEFPEELQREAERYLATLTRRRRTGTGRRSRPLKPSTIRQCQAELEATARKAVNVVGVPIETLDSLAALLAPAVVEEILDAYWRENGDSPKVYTIDLAKKLLGIARETKCLNEADLERLADMHRDLEDHRREGLTDKNTAFLRQVLTPGIWGRVVNLPMEMMANARSYKLHARLKAAVEAELAVAIAIETVAPVRLANLATIKLGFNLIKPDGPDSNYWFVVPDHEVKNRVPLQYPLPRYVTDLINEYVHEFRPTLLRGSNGDWLFPGRCGGTKQPAKFSTQIARRIFKATGLDMTVHQFRHAAGALILKHHPGNYELVRRLLGHRHMKTTTNAYVGLENIQASEIFSKIVIQQLEGNSEDPE
jgi:hypothetical protein